MVEEISIPTPYGVLAAKAWGNKTGFPVLALHGYQDNAGTFDKLIPLLSPSLYIVALDIAGHGLSSHKPSGSYYNFRDIVLDIKRVIAYLDWKNFSIIGHCLGGAVALLYVSIFPERVANIVMLDIVKVPSRSCHQQIQITRTFSQKILDFETKSSNISHVYSVDEARKRLIEGTFGEITTDSADILLKRGSKPSKCGSGIIFTKDIKLKFADFWERFSHDLLKEYMNNVKCNLLLIKAKDTAFQPAPPKILDDFIAIYKRHCNSFQYIEVRGSHYVHLNQPEIVAPHINAFFENHLKEIKSML